MTRLARALVLSVCFVASASAVFADTVTATWNANPPADNVTAYVLSYGTTSGGPYTTSIDVGNVTMRQVTLSSGQRYYFVVQARNAGGLSSYSIQASVDLSVPSPPAFTTQPTSQTVTTGSTASFTVVASGTPAPTYQWQVSTNGGATFSNLTNTAPHSGATTATLSVTNVTAGLTGNQYRAVATSSTGAATSTAAALTVAPVGSIVLVQHGQMVNAGSVTTASKALASPNAAGNFVAVAIRGGTNGEVFTVTDTRGNLYQKAVQVTDPVDGQTLGIFYAQNVASGANTVRVDQTIAATLRFAILEYAGVATANALDVTVAAVGNSASPASGSVTTTASGDLLLGLITTGAGTTVTVSGGYTLQEAAPAAPITKVAVADRRQAVAGPASVTGTLSPVDSWAAAVVAFKAAPIGGGGVAPAITMQPTNQTVTAGATTSFVVAASGTPTPTYQWQVSTDGGTTFANLTNAAPYSGVTTTTVTVTGASAGLTGNRYRAVATNSAGSATSTAAILTVNAAVVAPAITAQPAPQTVAVGATTSFVVAASGTPVPTYQWQVSTDGGTTFANLTNAAPYSGVTTTTVTITGASAGLTGNRYRAVATNSAGSATSTAAILTVNAAAVAPVVTTQPTTQTVTAGANVSFAVVASGTPAPTYQWQVSTDGGASFANLTNTAPYSGVTTATVTVTGATTGLTGNRYRAVATNTAGSATSAAATLTVTAPSGSIVLVQHAQLVNAGSVTTAGKAFASANAAGNFVAVAIRGGTWGEVFTVTDTRANVYQKAVQITDPVDGQTLSIFYAQNVASGANTVTVRQTVAATLRFAILEYAGVATVNALDVAAAAVGNNASPKSASATTTVNGDLLLGLITTGAGTTVTVTGGYTLQEAAPAAPITKVAAADRRQAAAGPASITGTLSPADSWAAALAAFKAAPAGGAVAALTIAQPTGKTATLTPSQTVAPTPIGSFDAPSSGAASVQGAVALSGWALSATNGVAIARVEIWRDVVPGETTPPYNGDGPGRGKIFVATAPSIDGARPDIEALFAGDAHAVHAGWGALVLTRGLSSQGDGPYTLHAIGYDAAGASAVLGTTTLTVDNAHATQPFGRLDLPMDGVTVSGTITVTGWALTPGASCTIKGSGLSMGVDTGPLVPVRYGLRSDAAAVFSGFTNSTRGGAEVMLDTTALTDGLHQISWSVTDTCGRQAWIGSGFVTVHNASTALATVSSASSIASPLSSLTAGNRDPIAVQTGTGTRLVSPNARGVRTVLVAQGDYVGVQLPAIGGATYAGFQAVNGGWRALPLGSTLQTGSGQFAWQPAANFLGSYDLVFVATTLDGASQAVGVRVIVGPSARLSVDPRPAEADAGQPFELTGWAIDLAAADGSGFDAVELWATPAAGGTPIRLGAAATGEPRPDIAAMYGEQFRPAGFRFLIEGLRAGAHDVRIVAQTAAGTLRSAPVRVTVR